MHCAIHTLSYCRPTNPVCTESKVWYGPTLSTFTWPELLGPCWGFSATWDLLSLPAHSGCGGASADPLWGNAQGAFSFQWWCCSFCRVHLPFCCDSSFTGTWPAGTESRGQVFIHFYSFLEVLRNLWPVCALKASRGHTAVLPRKQADFREVNATGNVSEIHWSVLAQYPGYLYWPV